MSGQQFFLFKAAQVFVKSVWAPFPTHLDSVEIMAKVLQQQLHTAVVTVSHEHVVLLFSTTLS